MPTRRDIFVGAVVALSSVPFPDAPEDVPDHDSPGRAAAHAIRTVATAMYP